MPMDTRLYIAIKKGDKNVVEKFKEQFAAQLTANKSTVLHVAAESKGFYWEESTDFLAMVGWDMLFSKNSSGDTCLHLATRSRHYLDAIKAIIDYMNQHELPKNFPDIEADDNIQGASALLRMTNNDGKSPLYVAVEEGNKDAVEYILNKCSSPSYAGPCGTTALHEAAQRSSGDKLLCMKLLLEKKPSLTKQADNFGWNPLHYAACTHYTEATVISTLLLADKLMAYETIKEHNMTPLHIAAIRGSLDVMKEIVEQCPDSLDAVTSQGRNVLHLAYSTNQDKAMIDFLKEQTVLYNLSIQRDADGNNPCCARGKTVLSHPLFEFKSVDDAEEAINDERKAYWKETSNTHLIVATLILTISFAAGFTIPGGFRSSDDPNEGMAILGKQVPFKAFVITDTIAMITSSSAVFLHYLASLEFDIDKKEERYSASALLVMVAMIAMMIVFMTGLYVMQPSTSLAVFICVSCSLSIFFFIFILYKKFRHYLLVRTSE